MDPGMTQPGRFGEMGGQHIMLFGFQSIVFVGVPPMVPFGL